MFSSFHFTSCFKYLLISIKSYGLLIYGRDAIQNAHYFINKINYDNSHSDIIITSKYILDELYIITGTTQGVFFIYLGILYL